MFQMYKMRRRRTRGGFIQTIRNWTRKARMMLEYLYDRAEELWTRRKVRSRRIHYDDQPFWRRWWGNAVNNGDSNHIKAENEVDKLNREIAFLTKSLETNQDERGVMLLSQLTAELEKMKRRNKSPSPQSNSVKAPKSRSTFDRKEGVDGLEDQIRQLTEHLKTHPDDENAILALSVLTDKLDAHKRNSKPTPPKNTTVRVRPNHDRIESLKEELRRANVFITSDLQTEREKELRNTVMLETIPKLHEELYRLTGKSKYKQDGENLSFEDRLDACGIPATPITTWDTMHLWDGFVYRLIEQYAMGVSRPKLQRIKTDEYPNLISIYHTEGDGNCLVHSFLIMISSSYRSIVSDANKTVVAKRIREQYLSMYHATDWLQDGALAYLCKLFGVNAIVYRTRTHSKSTTLQVYKNDERERPFIFIHNQADVHYSGAGYDGNCITSWGKGNELLARLERCGVHFVEIDYADRTFWQDKLLKPQYIGNLASIPFPFQET